MGINLSDIVVGEPRKLEDFRGQVIAIDAFNTLYQFLAVIRQPDGTPLKDRQGRVTSHLSGIIYRTSNFIEAGIKPVFVFDGEPPRLKAKVVADRGEIKKRAEREWKEALDIGDLERARSKAMQTSRLTSEMVAQSQRLIEALGVPWVQSPGEGEAQASAMASKGDAFAAASQDYDSLLFGAPFLARNLAISGRRKLPRKNVYVNVEPEVLDLEATLKTLEVTRAQLVDVGILMGTDFNEGLHGIGPKKALQMIKRKGSAETALQELGASIDQLNEVREIFLNPKVTYQYELRWNPPDNDRVREMLCEGHDFSKERIDAALQRIEESLRRGQQRSLDQWFQP